MFLILAIVLLMVWGVGSLSISCGGRSGSNLDEPEVEVDPQKGKEIRISKVWDEARLEQAGKQMKEMKSKKAHAA
jgi:hypothetical protein